MSSRSFLGKCKGCKRAVQASCEAQQIGLAERLAGKVIRPVRASWLVTSGKRSGFVSPCEPPWNGKWQIEIACPHCDALVMVQAVAGKVSEKHKCGARCLASTGPNCECSCGGTNHGKSHAA